MMTLNRSLAVAALSLAIASIYAGEMVHTTDIVASNQVGVYDVARGIRQRDVLLADLRIAEDFETFHLPGARRLADILEYLENTDERATIVVYGYEERRDWYALYSAGHTVKFLADGVPEWLAKIVNPTVYRFAPAHERREFEEHLEISKYFGGVPRYSNDPVQQVSVADQIDRVRRGCGF